MLLLNQSQKTKMRNVSLVFLFIAAAFVFVFPNVVTHAYDPDLLQDICVAVDGHSNSAVFVNGNVCKDPDTVTAADFFYSGLDQRRNITSPLGSIVTTVFVDHFPGLNTLGVAFARIDFAPHGVNPPHLHPRASELLHVVEGTLYAGFILSNPANPREKHRLFSKVLREGDAFLFPRGLIHFQYNLGEKAAVAFASFGGQNPGVVTVANSIFGSDPPVDPDLLTTAFQLSEETVLHLQSVPWIGNGNGNY